MCWHALIQAVWATFAGRFVNAVNVLEWGADVRSLTGPGSRGKGNEINK